jgi:nucleotide-binding universal stress UspA family protein
MLWHVLIPLDGSQLAEKSLDMAKRILKPDGKITLLTSVTGAEIPEDGADNAPEQMRAYLEHLATNLKLNGFSVDVEMGEGDPADLIVQRAHMIGVEAIVMSTHGRSGLSRLLFGSVLLKVLGETPCPVVVVPNREQERVESEQPAAADANLGLDLAAQ